MAGSGDWGPICITVPNCSSVKQLQKCGDLTFSKWPLPQLTTRKNFVGVKFHCPRALTDGNWDSKLSSCSKQLQEATSASGMYQTWNWVTFCDLATQ